MIATITYTKRPAWLKIARPIAIWWLRAWIKDEERHQERLRHGGVYTAEMLAERDRNFAPTRALLGWWEGA